MSTQPSDLGYTRPPRGTRPANRRALIIAAATELFYRDGYANVGMSDIADAVAVGPSALYRHFGSKQRLLEAVIANMIDDFDVALDRAVDLPGTPDLPGALAYIVIADRHAGLLWRRESRHLPADVRDVLQRRVRAAGARLGSIVAARRPDLGAEEADLLGWCALGVAMSVSFHHLSLPEPEFGGLLAGCIRTVVDTDVPRLRRRAARSRSGLQLQLGSRRENLLAAAIELFARNGYANVSMEDIGARVGATGPSIYHHFAGKDDILFAALNRGAEWLRLDMNRAVARAADPADALHRLITSYCDFACDQPDVIGVLLTEFAHLPHDLLVRTRDLQLDYIADWVRVVRTVHPNWPSVQTRIRVQAVLGMLNDVALTPRLYRFANLRPCLVSIAGELLDASTH